jgi:citrate synthase
MTEAIYSPGLEGIIAGRTTICKVDEERGELLYRGYPIEELVESSSFEEVAYLLLMGELPEKLALEEFCNKLKEERDIPGEIKQVIRCIPPITHPMDVLKIIVGVLGAMDPDASSNTEEANVRKAIRLVSRFPTVITTYYRISLGKEPVKPDKDLSHAANFLYMLKGKEPEDFESRALDTSFILYAEHEFNASTFAARVTASTLSDMHSAVVSAIGALKGPLHGGANERAMEMLLEIGDPEKAEAWVKGALSRKKRIMGFGHRVYKKEDSRTSFIKKTVKELSEREGEKRWFDIARGVEDVMAREKGLHANLDFYSGPAYYLLGIPISLYTPIFAAARVVGWAAHVMEQFACNRLIRPRGEYTGPERKRFTPLKDRV